MVAFGVQDGEDHGFVIENLVEHGVAELAQPLRAKRLG
jgi:hypothetical protein